MKNIRNFCIISHIDHGKSTLADRFLEITRTIDPRKMKEQFLDMHPLERERGITIKLQPVRMNYENNNQSFVLNLIDTPGHVDFSYEVSRSLAAVEGAVLLVDAVKGVQAQTLANLKLAVEQELDIIPVINKIDLPNADVKKAKEQIKNIFSILNYSIYYSNNYSNNFEILEISAKLGTNVSDLLKAIIKRIKPPADSSDKPLKALIFDSVYDPYKGVVAYVRVFDGQVKSGDKILFYNQKVDAEVIDVGYFKPNFEKSNVLSAGEIGYIATGLKDITRVRVGDTVTVPLKDRSSGKFIPLSGYKEPNPVVFASIYPRNADDYELLRDSLNKLRLQDAALSLESELSTGLGKGFKLGFLGLLHLEIVTEKLRRDFGLDFIVTVPSVKYKVKLRNGREMFINTASDMPDPAKICFIEEPIVELEILSPSEYLGSIMKLIPEFRGEYLNTEYLSSESLVLKYKVPLAEIMTDFYEQLKSITSGYASVNWKLVGFKNNDLVKLDILVAGEIIEPFSKIIPKSKAYQEGRKMAEGLKELIPPQLFSVAIQAAVGSKIIARETIKARRKDVTGYLYGGDVTRKMKLLKKQKRGKERLKEMGKVHIPQDVYLKILSKR